jgi:glutaminyl-tRNA synthetase
LFFVPLLVLKYDAHAAQSASASLQVVTRFPPEPNGYLHIGHAKAMFVDFGMAAKYGGKCYLRFDDTNPEAESTEYIEHIKEIVSWMGWTYCVVTHSSDYFDQLYQFAVQLIDAGLAYVCHQTSQEIRACREGKERQMSPWRDRPIAESKRLFEDMRRCATFVVSCATPCLLHAAALSGSQG